MNYTAELSKIETRRAEARETENEEMLGLLAEAETILRLMARDDWEELP